MQASHRPHTFVGAHIQHTVIPHVHNYITQIDDKEWGLYAYTTHRLTHAERERERHTK